MLTHTPGRIVVNWCGHGQEEADDYWTLVPIVETVANRLRTDVPSEYSDSLG